MHPAASSSATRGTRESAAARIHRNRGYCRTVTELMRQHPKLQEFEPSEAGGALVKNQSKMTFIWQVSQQYQLFGPWEVK